MFRFIIIAALCAMFFTSSAFAEGWGIISLLLYGCLVYAPSLAMLEAGIAYAGGGNYREIFRRA